MSFSRLLILSLTLIRINALVRNGRQEIDDICRVFTVIESASIISTCFSTDTSIAIDGCTGMDVIAPTCIDTTLTASTTINSPGDIFTQNIEMVTPVPTQPPSPPTMTSTVYTTTIYTITSCHPTITECHIGHVTTDTISLYTTVCPYTEWTGTGPSPIPSVTGSVTVTVPAPPPPPPPGPPSSAPPVPPPPPRTSPTLPSSPSTIPSTPSTSSSTTPYPPISTDALCGPPTNETCQGSSYGNCCSEYGYCGHSDLYCGLGCQPDWGYCTLISNDGTCGNGVSCIGSEFGNCCSMYGDCGSGDAYCDLPGCQLEFGDCYPPVGTSSVEVVSTGVASMVSMMPPPAATSAVPSGYYISTVYTTIVYTITSCASVVTDCPAMYMTSTLVLSTTMMTTAPPPPP